MTIIKELIYIESLQREAHLYIGLPDQYSLNLHQFYPVFYFHDGHNMFFSEDSYAGQTWGLKEAFDHNSLPPCIVVALSCAMKGNQRIEEYNVFDSRFPTHPTWKARGRGMTYLNYLFQELKPMIDRQYRTLPSAKDTYMIGSSMGGVISLQAGLLYPELVGNIAGLSNAFYASTDKLIQLVQQRPLLLKKLYLDTGDQEAGLEIAHSYVDSNEAIREAIVKKNHSTLFRFELIKGGQHNETAWRNRLPSILKFLLLDNQ
jgi:predicted alpha/beta superfamily hydrolase